MKKEDIYVAVSGKKQAKQFKAILLALGEGIDVDYYLDGYNGQDKLVLFEGKWLTGEYFERIEITIKELIKLLAMQNDVVKAEEPKEVKIELNYGHKATINPTRNIVVITNNNEWITWLSKSDIGAIFNELNK